MDVLHLLGALPWWVVVGLVAVLPALEASAFVGLVVPGETAVVAGGLAAHAGLLPLWLVVLAAVCGAATGDQVGFLLGRRYGPGLLRRLPRRLRGSPVLDSALSLVRRRGAWAVVIGRWAASLRAVVPGVAGLSGVARSRFTVANIAGGAVWATAMAVAGDLAGASYTTLEHRMGLGSEALAAVVVVGLGVWVVRARRRTRTRQEDRGDVGRPRA